MIGGTLFTHKVGNVFVHLMEKNNGEATFRTLIFVQAQGRTDCATMLSPPGVDEIFIPLKRTASFNESSAVFDYWQNIYSRLSVFISVIAAVYWRSDLIK